MGNKGGATVVIDYLSGMSLDGVARKQGIPRSRVVHILAAHKIKRRTSSESHRLAYGKMSTQERRQKTANARKVALHRARPRGNHAGAILSWIDQGGLSSPHKQLADAFRSRGVNVQCNYPVGRYNLYLADPKALLAIEPIAERTSHLRCMQSARKVAYLNQRGWFVSFVSPDYAIHFESLVALAKLRAGAPSDLQQKRNIRRAMEPFFKQLNQGHLAAIAMAEAIFRPHKAVGASP